MRSGVVTALIVVFEEKVRPENKEASLQVGSAQAGLAGCDYIEASRLSSSEIVMPTSFLPPNTVPFLPLAMWSTAVL